MVWLHSEFWLLNSVFSYKPTTKTNLLTFLPSYLLALASLSPFALNKSWTVKLDRQVLSEKSEVLIDGQNRY